MGTSRLREFRRSRRLDIGRLVAGKLMPSGAAIRIRDISFGGFAMETGFRVRVGATHDFRFTSKDGSSFVLRATVAHTRRIPGAVGLVVYVSGLEFADQQMSKGPQAVDVLMEKVNWILSFYDDDRRDSRERTASGVRSSSPSYRPRRPRRTSAPDQL